MKTIQLTQGALAFVSLIDFDYLNQFIWHLTAQGYAGRDIWKPREKILMHNDIAQRMAMILCGRTVDHKDLNRLNNQRDNLRPATASQQMANKSNWKENTFCQYKGVSQSRDGRRFIARIKNLRIGTFDSIEEAAKAYDTAAINLFGDFAVLNFPGDSNG